MFRTVDDRRAANLARRIAAGRGERCHDCSGATGAGRWFDGRNNYCEPCGYARWLLATRETAKAVTSSVARCDWCGTEAQLLTRRRVKYCSAYCRDRSARSGGRVMDCLHCGDRFYSSRSTARYCSDRCRVRYSRAPALYRADVDITRRDGTTETAQGGTLWGTAAPADAEARAVTGVAPGGGTRFAGYVVTVERAASTEGHGNGAAGRCAGREGAL